MTGLPVSSGKSHAYLNHQLFLPNRIFFFILVATGGPALAFITYPEAIGMLPFPQFWAIIFFLMLFFLGLDSEFVQIEAIISSFLDEYPRFRAHKTLVAFASCFVLFIVSTLLTTRVNLFLWLTFFLICLFVPIWI